MIRDSFFRLIFIPLLGLGIPLLSGIIPYSTYTLWQNLLAHLYFIFLSLCIWIGCNWIHSFLRKVYSKADKPFTKIGMVCLLSAIYGGLVAGVFSLGWFSISREPFSWRPVYKLMAFSAVAVIVFNLIYEILFLSREREQSIKIVNQLDQERLYAELEALRNELDPHFIFNALNTLNHLIMHNPLQAHEYNNKLAQVYKYFLINKSRQLISLKEELEFIDNYYFLLQLRYDENLQLFKKLEGADENSIKIPPCALQLLLENAIKHNELSSSNRLQVKIEANGRYLKVSNNTKPKPYLVNSTGIGLKNLSSRYMLISKKDIVIENNNQTFTVKLPYIT
jgi:two-component system, LytTR family, sensor kinase